MNEMTEVNTRRFYLVDDAASAAVREFDRDSNLPPSYLRFVRRFGGAKLYRMGSVYVVQIFAAPKEAQSKERETLVHFGRTDLSLAYFKESLLIPGKESPVFEWKHERGLEIAADSFEKWLKDKCSVARQLFGKREWDSIVKGPLPFSEEERSIVEARKHFRWRIVGVAPNGDLRFEVHNGSSMTLPFLSIGIHGRLRPPNDGPLDGGVWLPVSSIPPGETRVIEKGCYKDLVDPSNIEAFEEANPEPEDRDRYWEFKKLT
ncbi:MAG: hypothetical protein AABZ53_08400 [Planctomycetota bacterium]